MPLGNRTTTLTTRALLLALLVLGLALHLPGGTSRAQDGTPPSRPARPAATSISHDSVTITWDDPQDDSITGYRILRRNRDTDALGSFTVMEEDTGSADTSYTDGAVEPSTRYGYRVHAINAHGISDRSRSARFKTPAAPEPTPSPTPEPTATPEPTPDYAAERAVAMGLGDLVGAAPHTVADRVNLDSDRIDYFDFNLSARKEVRLRLKRQEYDADLYLEDPDGNVIHKSENAGAGNESINATLDPTAPGDYYYVRVEAKETGRNDYEFRFLTKAPPQPQNSAATGVPAITGTVQIGETLSAGTSGISDGNGLTNVQYGYQWVHSVDGTDTDISGATGSSYTIASSDAGNAFRVKATFTDDDGYSETLTSAATDVVLVTQQQGSGNGSVSEPDGEDFPANNNTSGRVVVGGHGAKGKLGSNNDKDGFKIELESGKRYRVDVLVYAYRDIGNGGTFPGKPVVQMKTIDRDILGAGQAVRLNGYGDFEPDTDDNVSSNAVNQGSGPDNGARSEFDVTEAGAYLIVIDADGEGTGTYTVRASDITSEEAYGDFTSGFVGGRLKVDDTNAMTGNIDRTDDHDWYLALLEDGKCYAFHAKGQHSNPNQNGGTLNDPKIKLMKFFDYYEKQYYDPDTHGYKEPDPLTMEFFETIHIDPQKFENSNGAEEVCFTETVDGTSKEFCSYYCDDDGGQGNNSKLQVEVAAGGGGEYLLAVFGEQGSTGTYSLFVEEVTCPP